MTTRATVVTILLTALLALVARRPAHAFEEERNFAGSAQLDYHLVPGEPAAVAAPGPSSTFEGFTLEAATKVAVDISEHLSANVKACYGCHGFELDMAYFDLRAADELNLRVGRFSPTFGAFNLRHDPANHLTSDKPLPYDMGRMLRRGDWHNGVLPSPFPMNGAEINGTHWAGNAVQLDYAVYAATGFKNDTDPNPTDLNFQESHLPYYLTSDPRPMTGARLAMTLRAGALDATLGASALGGTYDPANKLTYAILGGDLSVRILRTAIRMEYLVRRQEVDTSDPDIFKYAVVGPNSDFFVKHGAYVEIEQPVTRFFDLLGRVDGMYRIGNVSNVPVGSGNDVATTESPLSYKSYVARETLAAAYALDRNFRLKGSVELWEFSYADASGRDNELSFHLGAVGSF
jgi:hypothetical protein